MERIHNSEDAPAPSSFDTLAQMPSFEQFREEQSFAPEPFEGSEFAAHLKDDAYGYDTQDLLPDLPDETPQILWRGERAYLGNIDQVGQRPLTTAGHERAGNRHGQRLSTSRDKYFAYTYAIGTDGVKFYDQPLSAEEIPIGVIYRINNRDNHLGMSSDDDVDGYFVKQQREYTTPGEIPAQDYEPTAFILMDDLVQFNQRSDFRRPFEVFPVDHKRYQSDKTYLPKLIQAVKKRHLELASRRSLSE